MRNPLEVIEDIQQKPEGARRSIAVVAILSIMAVIVGIWLTTFSIPSTDFNLAEATQTETPSPFSLLWNFVKESVK
ncbi:MAG: hypothetical protein UW30_C0021G0003 [Candidatus Giovannonibacteria bacterium GW2011_GWA2_44_13b]|uniref:Uncharacterized protein n=2 Tax=Candidatus Giovannoniibacteriota TaxID=1752738 RepID=A0A0G1H257_9BACT|nr:MAG: hypothetical protein UW30_C0021G0003 [Candidatus Giovannonibacteria bacterium GW2011_GWA2_44_13b]OGF83119.1 MAG: hypothetical protein A2924_04040 [Candidatus Giovannonibacteria bacterium RIFCSPLOWO2_01_FULL_44_16]